MEIKENEYIRYIPTNGWTVIISKVTKIECRMLDNAYYLDDSKEEVYSSHFDDIIKHSKDIIDLVEVGDYVNGCKVTKINIKCPITNNKGIECKQEDKSNGYVGICFTYDNYDIKSILTREQFESNAYKIEKEV